MKQGGLKLLHQKRKHAVSLYKQGLGIMQIVERSGLSYPTVKNVINLYTQLGAAAIKPRSRGRKPGSGRSLSQEQEQIIKNLIINQKPAVHGLDYNGWSGSAVAALIVKELDIDITSRAASNYLMRWGLSKKSSGATTAEKILTTKTETSFDWGPVIKRYGATAQTQAGKTALRLKKDIIQNVLKPGERLTFTYLSKLYGVGNSPLREALFQVMGEGLVLSEENKGFVVAPINLDEMFDISSQRAYLEAQALRLSIKYGDAAWEAKVVAANYLLKTATESVYKTSGAEYKKAAELWEVRHRDLHTALCSACRSPWLMYFIGILYEHLERYRRYFWDYNKRAKGADYEHEQIVLAALNKDADKAVGLLYEHFETQAELSSMAAGKDNIA